MFGGKEQQQGNPSWVGWRRPPQASRLLLSLLVLLVSAERCHCFTFLEHQWELVVQLLAVAVTNFFMALPLYAEWKACLVLDVVLTFFAMSSSTIYHALQAVEHYRGWRRIYFLCGSSLDWQKADNVFASACFSALLLQPLQITRPALLVGVQAVTLSLSSVVQNVGSWNMWGLSLLPVGGSALCLGVGLGMRAWHSRLPVVTNKGYLLGAGFSLPIAFAFFLLGLDDNSDYLRLKHGQDPNTQNKP
ncbi:hypothetical protein Esti_006429 [Eimeria stiedai]